MKQNGDPTVEEILASIKQVIARDTRVGGSGDAPRRETLATAVTQSAPETDARAEDSDDVLELIEAVGTEPDDGEAGDSDAASPLLTEGTRAAMRESLAALAAISGPGAVPQIVRSGETSLEGMARELLRPALTEWLDNNLPALVERLVAAEIARIVGKRR